MDALGSSFGIESLLGVPYALQEIKNVYPDPHRQGKYLYTYRFYYKGDGTDYFLGQAVPETHILTVEDCRSAVTADYDEDGIVELFVLTKYENAPYMLHELENGVITAYFIDEVPADVLENLKRAALDIM